MRTEFFHSCVARHEQESRPSQQANKIDRWTSGRAQALSFKAGRGEYMASMQSYVKGKVTR